MWSPESDVRLINLYGPTEASVEVTGYEVNGDEHAIPIGAPVPNTRTYVLDARLRQVPVGVAGELYLAGAQLADGYVNQESLTADRFVADPFVSVSGCTGPAIWSGGTPTAIWTTWAAPTSRSRSVASGSSSARSRRLCSARAGSTALSWWSVPTWAHPHSSRTCGPIRGPLLTRICRRRCCAGAVGTRLRYMVPAVVVVLDEFPVNSSGKLDRSALPDPMFTTDDSVPFVEPTTPTQLRLVSLLSELLDVERIGLRDNIFSRCRFAHRGQASPPGSARSSVPRSP